MFGTTWKYNQTENRIQFNHKIGYTTRKIISTLILPSIHFRISSLLTRSSHTVRILQSTIHSKLTLAYPSLLTRSHHQSKLHPTHRQERERELQLLADASLSSTPHSNEQCRRFPLRTGEFLPFLLHLTQAHLRPLQAHLELCMYPIHRAISLLYAGEALPSSNVSDLLFENVFMQACSVCMESVFTVCENKNRCCHVSGVHVYTWAIINMWACVLIIKA